MSAASELAALVERIDELGDGTNVYDLETGTAESYMVAGGGPVAWVTFLLAPSGVIRYAYVWHYTWGEGVTLELVPAHLERRLLDGLRADRAEAERHR